MSRLAPVRSMSSPAPHELRDPAGFARAYGQHARSMHATAMAVLGDATAAQDVVQDVFLRLLRRPEAFDERRGSLGPYLRLMTRSRAVDVWGEGRAASRAGDRLAMLADRTPPPDPPGPAAVDRGDLWQALERLPRRQREAVVLSFVSGLTAAEIAAHADVPLGTAK